METMKIKRSAGFTLVEIMVVVVILGLLATVGTVAYTSYLKDAQIGTAKTKCAELEKAIDQFVTLNPSDDISPDDVWDRMLEDKRIKRPEDLKDPWGERYQVLADDDGNYIVFSKGKDKQADTEDDVYSTGLASDREEDF